MMSASGTYAGQDRSAFNTLETALTPAHTCFEIVRFAFLPDVTAQRQTAAMKTLGAWVAAQPGFLSRQRCHDARQAPWTDLVEWSNLDQATAAMERSRREPSLAGIMALIDPGTLHAGHFDKRA